MGAIQTEPFSAKSSRKPQGKNKLQLQEEETKKRKQQDEEADVETPAKVPTTENDSEYEYFFNNTTNSEISNREEDLLGEHPTNLPPETEDESHSIAKMSISPKVSHPTTG